jgi:hypothetical protein
MNYLFSHLEGAAARSVQGLTLTEANYDAAIAILEERFGRPQQIIAAHMDELLKVQPCSNERSSSIRFVYDKIRVHVRGLEALGVTPEQYGSLLIPHCKFRRVVLIPRGHFRPFGKRVVSTPRKGRFNSKGSFDSMEGSK